MQLKRRFGMEFEHISTINREYLGRELASNKITVSSGGHGDYSGWQIKSDGSITPGGKYVHPIEIASPPIIANKYSEVIKALGIVSKFGAVNSSCGLHVHVSAPDLAGVLFTANGSLEWQQYVTNVWQAIEKVMFTYVPPSRRNNHYCHSGVQWETKYQAINLSSLRGNRRTIEFRLHNATLNPLKAFSFAILCQAIVDNMSKRKTAPIILPNQHTDTQPKRIRTKAGGEFVIQREKTGKWLIEAKNFKTEFNALNEAFTEYKKHLKLTGETYLEAFQYPHYGNAMTNLCDWVGINGLFRGYIEDRYERMLAKHGPADARGLQERLLPDEMDFYNEPDLEPAGSRTANNEPYLESTNEIR